MGSLYNLCNYITYIKERLAPKIKCNFDIPSRQGYIKQGVCKKIIYQFIYERRC